MNVPQLRFKEFSGEWDVKKLGEVAEIKSGGTPSRTNPAYWNGDIPWITTSLIDFGVIDKAEEYITKEGLKNSSAKIFPKGTLLMAMYGQGKTRGKIAILGKAATTNQACAAILLSNTISEEFAFQNLAGRYDEIRELSNAGSQENLSGGLIKQISFITPTLPEQTKIANFLTTIDERINQLTRKKELMTQYKQGVMQQIFSQQLRFKDDNGEDFGDWEADIIDNLISSKSKKYTPEQNKKSYPCIELEHISQNTGQLLGFVDSIGQKSIKNHFQKGDILFGKLRPYLRKFLEAPFDGVCSTEIWVLTGKKLINSFLFHYVQSNGFMALTDIQSGSKMPRADWSIVSSATLYHPSFAEQTKIANFLTALDEKIQHITQQIEATKQYKQGLLQQMFV